MDKSNSKKFFPSAVKNFAEEDFWKIEIAKTVTDNKNENPPDTSTNAMSVKFQKTIKHIRQMKYQKLKITTVNLVNATQKISKNGFGNPKRLKSGERKTDLRRRSQAQILYTQWVYKIACWWSFPTPLILHCTKYKIAVTHLSEFAIFQNRVVS